MKLLVFSDTHGYSQRMLDVLEAEEGADACFFLGDGAHEPEAIRQQYPNLPLYVVQGNCDMASLEPTDGLAPFGGVLFFYTHGHLFNVKRDLDTLTYTARRKGANAALFGHTHIPYYENRGGIHLFNPGSISLPRFGLPSFGRIYIQNQTPRFEIVRLEE